MQSFCLAVLELTLNGLFLRLSSAFSSQQQWHGTFKVLVCFVLKKKKISKLGDLRLSFEFLYLRDFNNCKF